MSSIETTINHDHLYVSNINTANEFNRQKCDSQTDEDYSRRRILNNASCRMSRIHRRSQIDLMRKNALEYEDLNRKLISKQTILIQVIDRLKEHVRSLLPSTISTQLIRYHEK